MNKVFLCKQLCKYFCNHTHTQNVFFSFNLLIASDTNVNFFKHKTQKCWKFMQFECNLTKKKRTIANSTSRKKQLSMEIKFQIDIPQRHFPWDLHFPQFSFSVFLITKTSCCVFDKGFYFPLKRQGHKIFMRIKI